MCFHCYQTYDELVSVAILKTDKILEDKDEDKKKCFRLKIRLRKSTEAKGRGCVCSGNKKPPILLRQDM